jgi:arsenate reductase-like glutaredoxin family protein
VFDDDGAAIQARDVLKVEIAKEKLQKTLELQQTKYEEYLAELEKKSHELQENIKISIKPCVE